MKPAAKQDAPEPESRARELIAIIQDLVQELDPQRAKSMDVNEPVASNGISASTAWRGLNSF